jgi:hypothetical protein
MAEDLTPKIVGEFHDYELQPGGLARRVVAVRYMLGRFGPYEKRWAEGDDTPAARHQEFSERAAKLAPFV